MGRGAAVSDGPLPGHSGRISTMYETIEPQVMTARYERAHVWGIDCVERLTWRGGTWEPGGEYGGD